MPVLSLILTKNLDKSNSCIIFRESIELVSVLWGD
jgi:hypothetical protein